MNNTESNLSGNTRKIPDLQKQIDKTFHTPKMQLVGQMAGPAAFIFGMFVLGVSLLRPNMGAGIFFVLLPLHLSRFSYIYLILQIRKYPFRMT